MFKNLLFPLLIACALLIHLLCLINTRFTLWPEMLVYPYLLNNGFSLYKDIINPYPPTLPYALSFFTNHFGYEPVKMQLLTWSLIALLDLTVFYVSIHIYKNAKKAIASLLFFIFVSIPFGVNGIWFDLIQAPLVLLAFFLLDRYLLKKNNLKLLISASLMLAISFFIKQQTVWAIVFFYFVLFRALRDRKNLLKTLGVSTLPFLAVAIIEIIILFKLNLLNQFFYWALYMPFFKASAIAGYVLLPSPRQLVTVVLFFLIFIPTLSMLKLKKALFIYAALATSLFAYPRFDYFHLIPAIAVLSVGFGQNLQDLTKVKSKFKFISVVSMILIMIFSVRFYLRNWTQEIRFFEKDVYEAATLIKILNQNNQPIFLQNVSAQILVLSKSLPTKPWADSFPWYLELNGIQTLVVEGIKKDNPSLIISKPYEHTGKYQLSSYRPQQVADFIDNNYSQAGKINESLFIKTKNTQ